VHWAHTEASALECSAPTPKVSYLAILHKQMRPALTPAMQAVTRFTYPGGMEG